MKHSSFHGCRPCLATLPKSVIVPLRTSCSTCRAFGKRHEFSHTFVLVCSRANVDWVPQPKPLKTPTSFMEDVINMSLTLSQRIFTMKAASPSSTVCHLRILSKGNINKDDEVLREELLQRLIDCQLVGPVSQIAFNQNPKRLALRELPHGCWSNVFLLYQAHCRARNQPVASKTTFFNVSQQWRSCLRFHKRSQHSVCSTCSRLKMLLRNATDTLQD